MNHLYILLTVFAVVSSLTILPPTKNCISNCKCKQNSISSGLHIIECDGPLTLNETSFTNFNKLLINAVMLEGVIIDQIQEGTFRDLKNLDDVVIVKSRIGSIDAAAFNNIKTLKFADCGFEDSPDLISAKLEELHFGNCQLEEIPKLNGLLSLTFLNLSGNYIKDVGIETFAELFDLEELYLTDNEIFKLPATIFINNHELNSLFLDNNPLKQFYLNTSDNIETLSLKNCHLETFDERSTQRLSTLNELNLSNNRIKKLSGKAFAHMKELSVINLSDNHLERLDDDIFSENPKLQKITLDRNSFKTLPNFFLKNHDVFETYTFSCKDCGLQTLQRSVFQNMRGILNLELPHNELLNIDDALEGIPSLKILDISYNNIGYISPVAFVNNTNLETLILAGNPLGILNPEVFAENRVLKEIDARNTTLQKLWSNNNNKITSLRKLLVSDNSLTTITNDDFKIVPRLEVLDLNNNPLVFDDKLCNVIDWLDSQSEISPVEYDKNMEYGFEVSLDDVDGFSFINWRDIYSDKCPQNEFTTTQENWMGGNAYDIDSDKDVGNDYEEEDDEYNYDEEIGLDEADLEKFVNDQNTNLTRASYILSVTSVFILTALVVLTFAVTITLCILRRNSNFNMQRANLPRFKIPLWYSTTGQKKHSGSVYRPLSEDLSGPKTPKLSRYEFNTTPTVHSTNP